MNTGRACQVLAAFVLLGGACRAADDRVFVSPSGGDAFEGTPARPVKTLEDEGKTFTGRDGDLFAALSFDPKPRTVRPLMKGSRRRWVLEFFVKPIVGAVTVCAAVSGESAAEASARLGAEETDFEAIRNACHKAWNENL